MAVITLCDKCKKEVRWPETVTMELSGRKTSGKYQFHKKCWLAVFEYFWYQKES